MALARECAIADTCQLSVTILLMHFAANTQARFWRLPTQSGRAASRLNWCVTSQVNSSLV